MDLTTYGYKRPDVGDTGEAFFPALSFNIDRMDAHSHDGVDSTLLTIQAVELTTQAIDSGDWGAVGAGDLFSQTLTLPTVAGAALKYDEIQIQIRLASTGEIIFPKVVKAGVSSLTISVNDDSLDLVAVYTT